MINDALLIGIAKKLNNESFTLPSYLAFGSTSITPSATDTSVAGEFDRNPVTSTRSTNIIKYIGTRLATEASNQIIYNTALVNSSTLLAGSTIMANTVIASLTHTTDFDIDVEYWFTISRG